MRVGESFSGVLLVGLVLFGVLDLDVREDLGTDVFGVFFLISSGLEVVSGAGLSAMGRGCRVDVGLGVAG